MTLISETKTEAAATAELAARAAEPKSLEAGTVYAVAQEDGIGILDTDDYAATPRHKQAHRQVRDAESFVAYLEKHGLPQTEIYADPRESTVVAVIDAHEGAFEDAGWQKHRLTLALQHTKSWVDWTEINGRLLGQQEFAEFIEQHATDVAEPAAGDLLTLAQRLIMTKDLEFESSDRLDNGETQLKYKEKITTKGLGEMEVPKELKLVLQPYVNGPRQFAYANFRVRLNGSRVSLGIVLIRPEEILEGNFADIVNEIRDGRAAVPDKGIRAITATPHPIYFGKP